MCKSRVKGFHLRGAGTLLLSKHRGRSGRTEQGSRDIGQERHATAGRRDETRTPDANDIRQGTTPVGYEHPLPVDRL